MQIRAEQLARFQSDERAKHRERVVAFFRQEIPDAVAHLDDRELTRLVTDGIERAEGYGIQTGSGLLGFVALTLLARPDFDKEPTVHIFLASAPGDPDLKIEQMIQAMLETRHRFSS